MESEGSLPCSQDLSTGPYPEPDESSPYYPTGNQFQEFFIRVLMHDCYSRTEVTK
jgi:hypothetical protein